MRKHLKQMVVAVALLLVGGVAHARSSYLSSFNSTYGTSGTALDTCNLCHPSGTSSFNAYGTAYRNAGSFTRIESLDSDGDGFNNITEIDALTFPGDRNDFPSVTPPPSGIVDIDVSRFVVKRRYDVSRSNGTAIVPELTVVNAGAVDGSASATLVAVVNRVEVYRQVVNVTVRAGQTDTVTFPAYTPAGVSTIAWSLSIADEDQDVDAATASTKVVQ